MDNTYAENHKGKVASFLISQLHCTTRTNKFLPMESKWLILKVPILHAENDSVGSFLFQRLSFEQWMIHVLK